MISLPKKCQNNSSTTSEEPSYATVEKEGPSSVATDRKDLTASDKHQYVNRLFADRDKSTNVSDLTILFRAANYRDCS